MTLAERWMDKSVSKMSFEIERLIQIEAIWMGLSLKFEDQYQNLSNRSLPETN